jgi:hypothetical protein
MSILKVSRILTQISKIILPVAAETGLPRFSTPTTFLVGLLDLVDFVDGKGWR